MSRMTLYPTCLMCLTYLRALSAHYLTCLPAFITFPPLCLPFLCVMHAFSILRAFVFTHALYDLIFCVPCVPSFFLTCFHFSSTFIILSALILLTCIRFSYMPSYFICAFIFLVLCMLSYLTVFIFYVPSPFYVPTFYLRPFAFSICFHIFYVLLKWFTFFAYLTCLNFLHAALLCFIFYSQMPNKGGKGAIDWFFIFPGH